MPSSVVTTHPTTTPSSSARPKPATSAATPKPAASQTPPKSAIAAATAKAVAQPSQTPVPHLAVAATAAPATTKPVAATPKPATASGDDRAAGVVRSYLEALARGDRATAGSYLASGLPSETFMSPNARIESIHASPLGTAQYRVTADVQTTDGEYYVIYTVQQGSGGLQITDHYALKPQ